MTASHDNLDDRIISGEPKYYTTGQVADRLNEPDSTIRFWCDEFDDFLKIERTGKSGTRRRFVATDVDKIEYIRYLLKDENLSIKQVKEFLSSPEGEKMLPITKEKEQIMVEALANAVAVQLDEQIEQKFKELEDFLLQVAKVQADFQEQFKEELREQFLKEKETTRKLIEQGSWEHRKQIIKLEETIDKRLDIRDEEQKSIMEREQRFIEYVEGYREEQEKRQEKEKNKKGFFSRLFKKED